MLTTTTISAMRPRAAVASAICILALLAACNGDDSTDPAPTASAPATSDATPPTDAPTTSTTSTTTTSTPTPTTIDTETLIAEIEADLNAGEQAFLAGAADPGSQASRDQLARYFTGEALEILTGFYDELVEEGLTARANPDVPSVIVVNELLDRPTPGEAQIVYCRIDAGVVIETFADGSEAIFNDEIFRYVTRSTVVQRDDIWIVQGGGETLSSDTGFSSCS
jgi:hypothetical protein